MTEEQQIKLTEFNANVQAIATIAISYCQTRELRAAANARKLKHKCTDTDTVTPCRMYEARETATWCEECVKADDEACEARRLKSEERKLLHKMRRLAKKVTES